MAWKLISKNNKKINSKIIKEIKKLPENEYKTYFQNEEGFLPLCNRNEYNPDQNYICSNLNTTPPTVVLKIKNGGLFIDDEKPIKQLEGLLTTYLESQ